jgi:exodeoxyribonuclease V
MQLSNDQQNALSKLLTWYKSDNKKPYITLGGYAGTGKTTLISIFKTEILKTNPKLKIAFCSYTGKAVQNLKNRLKEHGAISSKDTISTIHGLIYNPIENGNQEIVGWSKKDLLEFDLIIVDEASMVDDQIWHDLLYYKTPIIAVGDHGQLPPIKGKFNLMEKPELMLNEIHRQAKDNPIIKVSQFARTTGIIPSAEYSLNVRKFSRSDPDSQSNSTELLENYSTDTLILCGYNTTRIKLNQFIRNTLGFENEIPEQGDRVICLRNNNKKGIYNGMLGTIQNLKSKGNDWYNAEILMDDNAKPYSGLIYAPQFGSKTPINFTENRKLALDGDLFDFGYALTVHKAQGSQAKRVIMFEERFKQMDDEMWRRWLYTGVTRAQEELFIFGE